MLIRYTIKVDINNYKNTYNVGEVKGRYDKGIAESSCWLNIDHCRNSSSGKETYLDYKIGNFEFH